MCKKAVETIDCDYVEAYGVAIIRFLRAACKCIHTLEWILWFQRGFDSIFGHRLPQTL